MYLMLSEDSAEKPKKKRGRPKGSKNKSKTQDAPKEEKQEFETKLGETAPEKPEKKEADEAPKKEEKTKVVLSPPRKISADSFTNKRGSEVIFRREMGEPEFFLHKSQLAPPRPVLSPDEEQEISRKVQIPTDQTPKYEPQYVLSQEYSGLSNYERGVETHKQELEEKLRQLKQNPEENENQIKLLEDEINSIDYLYENYNLGMNVFRTAKGGRSKIKA